MRRTDGLRTDRGCDIDQTDWDGHEWGVGGGGEGWDHS